MSEFGQQLFFDLPFFFILVPFVVFLIIKITVGYFISLGTLYHWILYIIGHFISLLEQYVHAENISSSGPYIVSAAVLTTHQGYFYF